MSGRAERPPEAGEVFILPGGYLGPDGTLHTEARLAPLTGFDEEFLSYMPADISSAAALTAGVTHDTTFEDWAGLVNNFQGDASMSLKNFRKNITIDVFNEADQPVLSYNVYRCWVSEFQALADLDASANAVLIQTIKLENEGWERDKAVAEPTET